MGEAEVDDVVDEVLGQPAVGQALPPRPEVHLVDAHRPAVRVARGAAPPSTPRRASRGAPRRRWGRCSAAPRSYGPSGRSWCGRCRRLRGSRTGSSMPAPTPGRNSSQMPLDAERRIGWTRPSQPLKSPTTWTALARGRPQGERNAPDVAQRSGVVAHVGAEHGPQLLVPALVDEVPVDLAEGRREAVGVVLLVLDAVAVGRRAGGSHGSLSKSGEVSRPDAVAPRARGRAPRRRRSAPGPSAASGR